MLKSIFGPDLGSKEEVPIYSGSLDRKELIDWINALNKHFDYAEVKEDKKLRFVITKLSGNASL